MNIQNNNQLQDAVAAFANQATTTFKGVTDVAAQQFPDILQQYIKWGLIESGYYCILGFLIISAGVTAIIMGIKKTSRWGELSAIPITIGSASLIPGCMIFFLNIQHLIQIYFTPKVWLIQQAVHLVK